MKTTLMREKGCYLLIAGTDRTLDGRKVLAAMTLMEGTGCWMVTDIRLAKHRAVSAYSGSVNASDVRSQMMPKNDEEADFIKSLLREFTTLPDGTIEWCPFGNIIRGNKGVNGYIPVKSMGYEPPIYHSKARASELLRDIRSFWNEYDEDPNLVKIPNPDGQPTETEISMKIYLREYKNEQEGLSMF